MTDGLNLVIIGYSLCFFVVLFFSYELVSVRKTIRAAKKRDEDTEKKLQEAKHARQVLSARLANIQHTALSALAINTDPHPFGSDLERKIDALAHVCTVAELGLAESFQVASHFDSLKAAVDFIESIEPELNPYVTCTHEWDRRHYHVVYDRP